MQRKTSDTSKASYRQLKFACPEEIYRRLKSEKVKQDRPLQELLVEAVEQMFDQWERDRQWSKDAIQDAAEQNKLRAGLIEVKSESFYLKFGELHLMQMWYSFIRELPKETVTATAQLVEECLKYFRSSRLKGPESH